MRKWVPVALLFQAALQGEVIRFDHAAEGSLPPGWTVAMTHSGGAPKWMIVRDESAPHPPLVLAQVSRDPTAGRFPLVIWDRASLRNGEVSVAFKPVDGSIDRAAGIVWRYQLEDPKIQRSNYFRPTEESTPYASAEKHSGAGRNRTPRPPQKHSTSSRTPPFSIDRFGRRADPRLFIDSSEV